MSGLRRTELCGDMTSKEVTIVTGKVEVRAVDTSFARYSLHSRLMTSGTPSTKHHPCMQFSRLGWREEKGTEMAAIFTPNIMEINYNILAH